MVSNKKKPTPEEFLKDYEDLTPGQFIKLDPDLKFKIAVASGLVACAKEIVNKEKF